MPKIVKTEMTLPIGGYQGSFSGKNSAKKAPLLFHGIRGASVARLARNSTGPDDIDNRSCKVILYAGLREAEFNTHEPCGTTVNSCLKPLQ